MLPRRPLTDLCLIAVFKQLPPIDQLKASQMSPRSAILVRAANRRVKTLIIADIEDALEIRDQINSQSISSLPSMQLTTGEPFVDYPAVSTSGHPMWTSLNLEHLNLFNPPIIETIVNSFSAVTELQVIVRNSDHIKLLAALLQHTEWVGQLTKLFLLNFCETTGHSLRLITAINGLSALQLLAFDWWSDNEIPELTILAQLSVIAVGFDGHHVPPFLRSLERFAAKNVNQQVHLLANDAESLLTLSQPLRSRIVRYGCVPLDHTSDNLTRLCTHFPALTSLTVYCESLTEVKPLLSALSQLRQLVHLNLDLLLYSVAGEDALLDELPPLNVQLCSVRALDLKLEMSSHSVVQWLNLQATFPHCQAIHLQAFCCDLCEVTFGELNLYDCENKPVLNSSTSLAALECYKATLFKLHQRVHPKQIILGDEMLPLEKLPVTDQ